MMNKTADDQSRFTINVNDAHMRQSMHHPIGETSNSNSNLPSDFAKRSENENLRYALKLNNQKKRNMASLESRLNLLHENERKMLIKIELERKKAK